ncbi:hypothetical protein NP284_11675, partial [Rhodopseudomonas pseudopalustris]|uniref:hypothetical protein n=1 Tax=Rhodopseudomonas pseudopalustris TaxID=1513892 RepID=UPI003F994BAE
REGRGARREARMMVVLAIGSRAFRARLDGAPTAAFSGFGTVLPAAASRQVSPPLAGRVQPS